MAGQRSQRDRAPLDQAQPSLDQRPGRANEQNDQGRDGETAPLRTHDQLRTHLADFLAAYNFAPRLKTRSGLTPYEYIRNIWTSEPDRFILDPIHQMPGLNT